MTTKARRLGSSWEIALLGWFRDKAVLPAERLHLAGKNDEGDLAVQDVGLTYIVEAKNEQRIDLARYVTEAELEAGNYARARRLDRKDVMALAIVKRRGKGVEDAYVVTTVREFFGA